MIIHIDSDDVTSAGHPTTASAECMNLKATVCLPPFAIRSKLPDTQDHLATMVQAFIENFGLHTANGKIRWERLQQPQSSSRPRVLTFHGCRNSSPTFSMTSESSISTTTSLCSRSPTARPENSDNMSDDDDMYVEDKFDKPTSSLPPSNAAACDQPRLKKRKFGRRETMFYQSEICNLPSSGPATSALDNDDDSDGMYIHDKVDRPTSSIPLKTAFNNLKLFGESKPSTMSPQFKVQSHGKAQFPVKIEGPSTNPATQPSTPLSPGYIYDPDSPFASMGTPQRGIPTTPTRKAPDRMDPRASTKVVSAFIFLCYVDLDAFCRLSRAATSETTPPNLRSI